MIRNVICLFCLFFMLSCKSIDLYYPNYANCSGYKSLFVVDTIQIDDPVSVLTNSGYCFVMSKQAFDSFSGNEDSLFKRPDTFLLNEYLPMSVSIELFRKYVLANSFSYFDFLIPIEFDKKGIKDLKIFTRKPDYFLLVLIRGDYYNGAYTGFDGPPTINLRNNKFSFYKIAIPCYLK